MNFNTFGIFIFIAGVLLLSPAFYFYNTVHNAEYQKEFRETSSTARSERAIGVMGHSSDEESYYKNEIEKAEGKAMTFGIPGGILFMIGLGMILSSKNNKDINS